MVVAALIVFGALVVAWLVAPAEERRPSRPIAREALAAAA